jgi:3-oxoacyl-[acyl-carrier protein] reductase
MSMKGVALVTGGSRGIGLSIVRRLLADGYDVWSCSKTGQFPSDLQQVHSAACDVGDDDAVCRFLDRLLSVSKRIDLVVNNAGVSVISGGKRRLVYEIDPAQWHRTLATNLSGAFYICRAAVPRMIAQESGCIINIASASARMGGVLASVDYISSKAGLVGLTKGLAFELGQFGIRVNAICPGRIETDMLALGNVSQTWVMEHVPLGRLGTPMDVAGAVSFLASSDASYITGVTLDCNGGWVIT